ncbi:hypothetical protein KY344_04800, partial [Candidatus Woesearchaeota archaeon]|nr:hypothetical protein [Candidatus Woesearchaeota archaeon]
MDPKNEKALVRAINKISEQGLVREFLQKRLKTSKKSLNRLSDEELTKLLLKQKEGVPASIFKTKLNPLEAITRYLKQKNKKITEIAKLLNKKPSAISRAYKNSKNKKFTIKKTKFYIPLSEFGTPKLSILETVVKYFRDKNLK